MGIVYVISNPWLQDLVKIGRTDRAVEKRMNELSRGMPGPFVCHAAWEFEDSRKVEDALHRAFADQREGKSEYFAISPAQPIAILEMFGVKDVTPRTDVADDENAEARKIREMRERFSLDKANIEPGSILVSVWDEKITCEVVDGTNIKFRGEVMSLSRAARQVLDELGKKWKSVSGPQSWRYDGKTLTAIRAKLES